MKQETQKLQKSRNAKIDNVFQRQLFLLHF